MERKLEVIKGAIQNAFPKGEIDYLFGNELHKFRIFRKGPPCWIYFTSEYIEDHNEQDILARLSDENVFEFLANATEIKWLAIGNFGVREVDDSFGRGY